MSARSQINYRVSPEYCTKQTNIMGGPILDSGAQTWTDEGVCVTELRHTSGELRFFSFVLGHALSQHLFVSKFYKFDTNHRLPLLEELISIYRRWFILKEGDEVSMDVKRYLIDKCLEF